MKEIKTISERITDRAEKRLAASLDASFRDLGSSINTGNDFYLREPPVIAVVVDKKFVRATTEVDGKTVAQIEVTHDENGNILCHISPYMLKYSVVKAYESHNREKFIEHEHKTFIKKVEELEYFAKTAEPSYESYEY